ncbi:hypothetical protein GAY28_27190 [Azospirillum brasilense]|nr:hypothetical protein [Azospirillum brasilense]
MLDLDLVAKLIVPEARALAATLPERHVQAKVARLYLATLEHMRGAPKDRQGRPLTAAPNDKSPDDTSTRKNRQHYRNSVTFGHGIQLRNALQLYDEAVETGDQDLKIGSLYLMRESLDWLRAYPPRDPAVTIKRIQGQGWKTYRRRNERPAGGAKRVLKGQDHVRSGLIWGEVDEDSVYRAGIAVQLLTGFRPVEIQRGVQVTVDEERQALELVTRTAKTHNGKYGQPERYHVTAIDLPWAHFLAELAREAGGSTIVRIPRANGLAHRFWKIGQSLIEKGLIPPGTSVSAYLKRNEINGILEQHDPLVSEVGTGHKLKVSRAAAKEG